MPACRKLRTNVLYATLLRTELVDKCPLKCLCIVNLSETAVSIARSEIKKGAQEVGGNNRGPFVAKYLQPSGLRPPQPWCAAFMSWCLLSASKKLGLTPLPYFVSAREMFNWAKASGYIVDEPIAGCLVFFSRGGLFSWKGHCGIVDSISRSKLVIIEANRGPRVQKFTYKRGEIRNLLGFCAIEVVD